VSNAQQPLCKENSIFMHPQKTITTAAPPAPRGLFGALATLEIVFPDEAARPSVRTFRQWQRLRLIPFIKINRRTFFDPAEVRRALDRQFTNQVGPR
jgi:hypothetical protein